MCPGPQLDRNTPLRETPRAQESLPGASQGPVLLKIGFPLECAAFKKRGPGKLPLYYMVNIVVTLNVFVPPAVLNLCESLFHVNITAKLKHTAMYNGDFKNMQRYQNLIIIITGMLRQVLGNLTPEMPFLV